MAICCDVYVFCAIIIKNTRKFCWLKYIIISCYWWVCMVKYYCKAYRKKVSPMVNEEAQINRMHSCTANYVHTLFLLCRENVMKNKETQHEKIQF